MFLEILYNDKVYVFQFKEGKVNCYTSRDGKKEYIFKDKDIITFNKLFEILVLKLKKRWKIVPYDYFIVHKGKEIYKFHFDSQNINFYLFEFTKLKELRSIYDLDDENKREIKNEVLDVDSVSIILYKLKDDILNEMKKGKIPLSDPNLLKIIQYDEMYLIGNRDGKITSERIFINETGIYKNVLEKDTTDSFSVIVFIDNLIREVIKKWSFNYLYLNIINELEVIYKDNIYRFNGSMNKVFEFETNVNDIHNERNVKEKDIIYFTTVMNFLINEFFNV